MMSAQIDEAMPGPDLNQVRGTMSAGIGTMIYNMADFRYAPETKLEGLRLGELEVLRYQGRGVHRGERRRKHIIKDNTDHFVIVLPSTARCGLRQAGSEHDYAPGTLVIVSMTSPFNAYIRGKEEHDSFSAICVRVPGPLLRQRLPQIDDLCNCGIAITPGVSHIMQSLFEMSLADGPYLQRSDTDVLGTTLVDLMVNAARQASGIARLQLPPHRLSSLERTRSLALRFVEANLSNAELDTAMIAAHCRVSTRYLHAAFAAESMTVASQIRELRLQRCREALRCEALGDRSIIEIVGGWGFRDSASFSRAYRSRFGICPSQDRV